MPSPFPGMDPYLEGYLWVDVHNALASKIRQQLAPKIQPGYTVRLEVYLVQDTAPLTLPLMPPVEVRIVTVEIRDTASNTLVTSIEILSPVNKREPGITPYRQKRQRLYHSTARRPPLYRRSAVGTPIMREAEPHRILAHELQTGIDNTQLL